MATRNKIFITLMLLVGLLAGSCKKWVDVNYDPSQVSDQNATPDYILPVLFTKMALSVDNQSGMNEWMGYWAWPYHDANDPQTTYDIQDVSKFPGLEDPFISLVLFEQNSKKNNQPFYWGIAKFLKAFYYSNAVDIYNDIPYTEAFRSDIRTPRYDKGQFIYEDLMVQLDSALTLIKGAPQGNALHISDADIMCHGNKDKWYRIINTLKLRLLIHQANRSERQTYIQKEIAKIVQSGYGFLQSGEDADVNPGYTDQKPSIYFQWNSAFDVTVRNYTSSNTYGLLPAWTRACANTTAMDLLKGNRDPRLQFFYNPITTPLPPGANEPFVQLDSASYRGNRFGLTIDQGIYPYQGSDYVSQVGGVQTRGVIVSPLSTGIIKGYNMNDFIITSVESAFLQAEAVQRGWLGGSAETAYQTAVKESFRWLNVGGNNTNPQLSDDIFNKWYADESGHGNSNVSWNAAPDKYKLIMFQKYMALNGINPIESYTDYRRNGRFPAIPVSYNNLKINNNMPIRSPYPYTEYAQNAEHVKAEGDINIFTSKIWWMP
ncbi:SusD/RagB family nutrient-binding outer membrane lipoprotein [Mucilaginibacter ginsenosidivorax]|nr:SusD/RagB family nutrient-binding outer membrane lipoprotein [Mucilaginibacter ginsenosidivorax]